MTEPTDDETVTPLRVKAHPGLCKGWGECHRWGPDVYPLDAGGQLDVHLLEVPPELASQARIGAAACPEQAITLITPAGTPKRS